MEDFWGIIDDKDFEKIAHEYAISIYPNWTWIPTKRTRDGGKDGNAEIVNIKSNVGNDIIKHAWYEAKYTSKINNSIPLARIASTVLLGHNRRSYVERIMIITNSTFSKSTIDEIYSTLGEKVQFCVKENLEAWLCKKEQKHILNKYKYIKSLTEQDDKPFLLGNANISNINSIYNSVSSPVNILTLNDRYVLTFALQIPFKHQYDFKLVYNKHLLRFEKDTISAKGGTSYHRLIFNTIEEGTIRDNLLELQDESNNISILIKVKIRICYKNKIEISNKTQNSACMHLFSDCRKFISDERYSGIILNAIEGKAACGKSFLIENFVNDITDTFSNDEILFIKFRKNKELTNYNLIVRILIFITFNKLLTNNKLTNEEISQFEDDISALDELSIYNIEYTNYLRYLIDDNKLIENINQLTKKEELIPYNQHFSKKIVILDDLQFLNKTSCDLIYRIFRDLEEANAKIFLICAYRPLNSTTHALYDYIKEYNTSSASITLDLGDIEDTLSQNNIINLPNSISNHFIDNILKFKVFLHKCLSAKLYNAFDIIKNKAIMTILKNDSMLPFSYSSYTIEKRNIIDIVYFFNSGIKMSYLLEHFSEDDLNQLFHEEIIKFDHDNGAIIPYHDLYLEKIAKLINYKNNHLYNYACHRKHHGHSLEYYAVLGYFKAQLLKNWNVFFSEIKKLHHAQLYYCTHYILRRFFLIDKIDNYIKSKYDKAYLLFIYAYATFNVGDNNGRFLYEQARACYVEENLTKENYSLCCIILAEIANCDFWELNFSSIHEKFKLITTYMSDYGVNNNVAWSALMTIYTRYLSSLLFQDNFDQVDDVLSSLSEFYIDPKIEANFEIHLNRGLITHNFNNSPDYIYSELKSLSLLNSNLLGVKSNYVLNIQILKFGVISQNELVEDFCKYVQNGKINQLQYNYQISLLHLGICYALIEEYSLLEDILNEIVTIRDFPALAEGVYYNLKALLYIHQGDYNRAIDLLQCQLTLYSRLGNSFKHTVQHNIRLAKARIKHFRISYALKSIHESDCFLVELRL